MVCRLLSYRYVLFLLCCCVVFFFFKQKTAYEMRISDWSSDVCSSDLLGAANLVAVEHRALDDLVRTDDRDLGPVDHRSRCDAAERAERGDRQRREIGRASCRERVCQYV